MGGISAARVMSQAEQARSATALAALTTPEARPGRLRRARGCASRRMARAAGDGCQVDRFCGTSDMGDLTEPDDVVGRGHESPAVAHDDDGAALGGEFPQAEDKGGLGRLIER